MTAVVSLAVLSLADGGDDGCLSRWEGGGTMVVLKCSLESLGEGGCGGVSVLSVRWMGLLKLSTLTGVVVEVEVVEEVVGVLME